MKMSEIIPSLIYSSKLYYDYLIKENKGNEIIEVVEVVIVDKRKIKIKLSKKLYTPDEFSLVVNGNIFTCGELRVSDYDADLKTLTIEPPEAIYTFITNTNVEKIQIICDLKFLVKRVQNWYEWCIENNYSIVLNNTKRFCNRISSVAQQNIDECQLKAINCTLTTHLSYVWGAPGTGKTRYVLSNSVLSHIKAGERVLVIAPTNNALEQSLFGIIDVLESQGVERKDILRLGTPTRNFANAYTECCEVAGLTRQTEELQNIIDSLNEQKKAAEFYDRYIELSSKIIPAVKELSDVVDYLNDIHNQIKVKERKISNIQRLYDEEHRNEMEISQNINVLEKKKDILIIKLFSAILKRKRERIEGEILQLHSRLRNCISAQYDYLQHKNILLGEIEKLTSQLDYAGVDSMIVKIKEFSKISERFVEVVDLLSIENCSETLEALNDIALAGESKLRAFKFDCEALSAQDIQTKIDKYNLELASLKENSTEHRLHTVKVIAATIDRFLAKSDLVSYTQEMSKYKIHHVYLDEAGYCSLIKGLSLFACDVPITLLGDHMQLPPVCELNDNEFEKDDNYNMFLWSQSVLAVEDVFNYSLEEAFLRYKASNSFEFKYIKKANLTVTYRFGGLLSEILDAYVYKNGFKSANSVGNIIVKVVNASKRTGEKKRENLSEVLAIKSIVDQYSDKDYVILTPYRNQLKLITQQLPRAAQEQRIMTVHASQGREFDVVILSVVDKSDMYFTDTTNKLSKGLQIINTAVSRAKREIIVVCDIEYWSHQTNQLIAEIVNNSNCFGET